jgi:hypothetical protein
MLVTSTDLYKISKAGLQKHYDLGYFRAAPESVPNICKSA